MYKRQDLICSLGKKEDYKIRNFFFDSDGCEIEVTNLDVYGPTGSLAMTELLHFDVSNDVDTTDQTLTFTNALTFNKKLDFVGSVLSGEVTVGSKFFEFDNSASYISDLTDVPPARAFTVGRRDLKLIAQTNLAETAYPLEINFYTTFGNITKTALLMGGNPENPSGIKLAILGDGFPLQSGNHSRLNSFKSSDGDKVSGDFVVNYSSEIATGDDASLGLPYKIYLEHVEGDHSKQYSFLTGVKLSGSGLGYLTEDIRRDITFRSGDLGGQGTDGSAGIAGSTFGNSIDEKAIGLVSRYDSSYQTKLVEAHMSTIRTNLYSGDADAVEAGEGGSPDYNIFKMSDGSICTQRFNTADIVTLMPKPDGNSTKETPSGIAEIFSYNKPSSDWKLFTGDADKDGSTYIQHTATGKDSTPLSRHKFTDGENEIFLGMVLQSTQYFDADPMVYRLVVSGADGYTGNALITGTVMEHTTENVPEPYRETIPETPLLY